MPDRPPDPRRTPHGEDDGRPLSAEWFKAHDFGRTSCADHDGRCCPAGCHDLDESQYRHYARLAGTDHELPGHRVSEAEAAAAVDAAARVAWAGADAAGPGGAAPSFDDLRAVDKLALRESVLPRVWAALAAVPDGRAVGWEVGYARAVLDAEGDLDRADNPYLEP